MRRWSDAGLIPVERIGRRRTRRFREPDLIEFRQRDGGVAPAAPGRLSGINVGGVAFPPHTHVPTFYDSDAGRLRLSVPLLRDGLFAGEKCLLVASKDVATQYLSALRESGVDGKAALAGGQLEHLTRTSDSIKTALDQIEAFFWRATQAGSKVPRIVGEMSSERQAFGSDAKMLDYEFALNALTKRFAGVVLCQYDARDFDGLSMLRALKAHPDLFELRLGDVLL